MLRVYNQQKIISELADEIAYLQNAADYWYYIVHDQDMSSFLLDYVTEARNLANRLGILEIAHDEALKIYDFSNSGRSDYEPDIEYIQEIHDMFEPRRKSSLVF